MLTESDVIAAVCNHLRTEGYEIRQQLTEKQSGDDIVAVRGSETLLIEAKGETSSKPGTHRHGKPFNRSQALSHVSRAFYRAAKMRRDGVRTGMAFPSSTPHLEMVEAIQQSVAELGIVVFWVDPDKSVRVS